MIKRYWIVTCNYCGREYRFDGNTKPSDQQIKERGIVVCGPLTHYCDERCAADANHDMNVKRAGNLKQFQPGNIFERK